MTQFEIIKQNGLQSEIDTQVLFSRILGRFISTDEFEEEVMKRWNNNSFLSHATMVAESINQIVQYLDKSHESSYGADVEGADFSSKWLISDQNKPGAIYINAPAEQKATEQDVVGFNRDMHIHDSARGALILKGNPIFHFRKTDYNGHVTQYMVPLIPGDLILWPKDTPHTFNAMDGFSLLSIISKYISPDEDGFSYPIINNHEILTTQSVKKLKINTQGAV
jgi:hypothetical protein